LGFTHLVGLPDPEDGHAGDDGVGVVFGGRVDGVVGADDQNLQTSKVRLVGTLAVKECYFAIDLCRRNKH
jgi:hypothetical protein